MFSQRYESNTFLFSGLYKLFFFFFSQKQSLICCLANPHYGSLIHANGHAEVWTDWNDIAKFFQYGWRCNTNENAYSIQTLMGNWNQDRFDLKYIMQPKPLPSQVIFYFLFLLVKSTSDYLRGRNLTASKNWIISNAKISDFS